jgi:hypothetical protein
MSDPMIAIWSSDGKTADRFTLFMQTAAVIRPELGQDNAIAHGE